MMIQIQDLQSSLQLQSVDFLYFYLRYYRPSPTKIVRFSIFLLEVLQTVYYSALRVGFYDAHRLACFLVLLFIVSMVKK